MTVPHAPVRNMVYSKFTVIQTLTSTQKTSESLRLRQLLHLVSHVAFDCQSSACPSCQQSLGQRPSKQPSVKQKGSVERVACGSQSAR